MNKDLELITKSHESNMVSARLDALETMIASAQRIPTTGITSPNKPQPPASELLAEAFQKKSDNFVLSRQEHTAWVSLLDQNRILLSLCKREFSDPGARNFTVCFRKFDEGQYTETALNLDILTQEFLLPYRLTGDVKSMEGFVAQLSGSIASDEETKMMQTVVGAVDGDRAVAPVGEGVTFEDMAKLFEKVPVDYLRDAVWVMTAAAYTSLVGSMIKTAQVVPHDSFLHKRIVISDALPENKPVILVNFSVGCCIVEQREPYIVTDQFKKAPDRVVSITRGFGCGLLDTRAFAGLLRR